MKRDLMLAAAVAVMLSASGVAVAAPTAAQTAAVADKARPEADTKRDAARMPAQMMEFAGIKPGQTVADVVMAEKQRENRIRRQGWWLVRWGWDDLRDVQAFGRLIREAFANAPRVV